MPLSTSKCGISSSKIKRPRRTCSSSGVIRISITPETQSNRVVRPRISRLDAGKPVVSLDRTTADAPKLSDNFHHLRIDPYRSKDVGAREILTERNRPACPGIRRLSWSNGDGDVRVRVVCVLPYSGSSAEDEEALPHHRAPRFRFHLHAIEKETVLARYASDVHRRKLSDEIAHRDSWTNRRLL